MEISIDVLIADSRLAFVQGRYNESLKLADEALKVDENNSDAHQCAGNAYMSKQDYDNAIEHYKIAVENDADNGDRYFNLGYAYATSNQPVKALEMFAKADEIGCSPNVVGQLFTREEWNDKQSIIFYLKLTEWMFCQLFCHINKIEFI